MHDLAFSRLSVRILSLYPKGGRAAKSGGCCCCGAGSKGCGCCSAAVAAISTVVVVISWAMRVHAMSCCLLPPNHCWRLLSSSSLSARVSGLKGDAASVRCLSFEHCAGAPSLLVETGLLSSARNSSRDSSGLRLGALTLLAGLFVVSLYLRELSPRVTLSGRGHAYVASVSAHVVVPVVCLCVAQHRVLRP